MRGLIAKKIPSKPRYEYAKRIARKTLLLNNITSLPVDIDAIFKNNNILFFLETQAEKIAKQDLPVEFKRNQDIHAITQKRIVDGKSTYVSIIKDRGRVRGNIRFSKAHELGHIFLKHFEIFDLPSSLNINLSHEYWVLEREAEVFAAELLAPTTILRLCNCYDKKAIKALCDLSDEASEYAIGDIWRDYNVRERERIALECQFENFLRNKKYLLFTSFTFCSVCGAPLDPTDLYCRICGFKIPDMPDMVVNHKKFIYTSTIPLKENGRVYYCLKCGETDLPIASTCNVCGAPIYNFCINCANKLTGNDRFCGSCGNKSSFFLSRLIKAWPQVQKQLETIPSNKTLELKKITCWEYIVEKLLYANKLDAHKMLLGSCGYDDCGKLVIAFRSCNNNHIDKDKILNAVNSISLPYFDITYDGIDILYV